jgi:hypothetical protein
MPKMRRIFELICILMLLSSVKGGEELIFFADDYYKVIGSPKLVASVINPAVTLDNRPLITIALANNGIVEEIIPINNSISSDAAQELIEEMRSTDAIILVASLEGNEIAKAFNDTQSISFLPSGSVEFLTFNISTEALPQGWQELLLELEYEHQVDVGIYNGKTSPLYQQDKIFLPIKILIENAEDYLRVLSVKSEFHPWGSGLLLTSIKNKGHDSFENCTARLIAAPPFSAVDDTLVLGDISPGEIVVARFPLKVEPIANPSDYELTLYLTHRNGTAVLSVPLTMEKVSTPLMNYMFIAFIALGIAIIVVRAVRSKKSGSRKSLRKRLR